MTPARHTLTATTPKLQTIVLGKMREDALQTMVGERSKAQDVDWLRTMLESDLLGVDKELEKLRRLEKTGFSAQANLGKLALCSVWEQRACALTRFMENIDFGQQTHPDAKSTPLAVYGPGQGANDDFKAMFVQGVQRLIVSHQALNAKPADLTRAMGHWLAAACALDLPEQVNALIQACPKALTEDLPLKCLGPHMLAKFEENVQDESENVSENEEGDGEHRHRATPTALISPLFVALQLSRTQCMDILLKDGARASHLLGKYTANKETCSVYPHDLYTMMPPVCTEQSLTQTLAHMLKHEPGERENMFASGVNFIAGYMPWMRAHLPAFVDAGVLDFDRAEAIRFACTYGASCVVERFLPAIPWQKMGKQFKDNSSLILTAAASFQDSEDGRDHEKAIATLLDQAIKDGQSDLVFQTFLLKDSQKGLRNEPLFTLVEAGWSDAVVKFLDHGFDPHAKVPGGTISLLDLANDKAPGMAELIYSHQARQEARALLSEIELTVSGSIRKTVA